MENYWLTHLPEPGSYACEKFRAIIRIFGKTTLCTECGHWEEEHKA